MEKVITTEEFTNLQNNGRVYICRPCFDNKKLIVMLRYDPEEKSGTFAGLCDSCSKAMASCIPCKSKPPPNPRNP